MLKINNLYCGYRNDNPVLKGINLTIETGDVLAVIGTNGAGKSTLAKAIVNSLPFRSATITFKETDITKFNTKQIINSGISVFSQGGRTFPQLSVKENIEFAGRSLSKKQFNLRYTEIANYFEFLHDNSRINLKSSYLSGGEKSRLAMAMALINRPLFVILDEPSAGLSPANVERLFAMLRQVKDNEDITVLLIEQNQKQALAFCNRYIVIENGVIAKEETK